MSEENKELENEELENEEIEDQTEDKSGEKNGKSSEDAGLSKLEKTFSQDQVTKMMTKEKNQGRNSVYKELGIDPKDSKMVAMVKAMIASQKTDEQKQAETERENQAKINEAEQRAMIAEAKAEAMTMGVKSQFVDDIVTLALAKMSEDSDLKTIIGEFKTKYPVWFGADDSDDKKGKVGQKGTGSSIKTSKEDKKDTDKKGMGQRLAAQRKSKTNKSSYWGKNK